VHQHCQLSRDGHNRSLLGVLATAGHQAVAPAPEIRIGAKVPQYVLRASDQKSPQEMITRFGYGQLRPTLSGIIASRPQSKVATDIPALVESMWIIDGQHKRQARQCSYSVDLLDQLGSRISGLGQLLNLLVVGTDLGCEHAHLFEEREQRRLQRCGNVVSDLSGKILGRAGRQARSERLDHAPHRVDEFRADTDQTIPGMQQRQIGLRFGTAVADRMQQVGIHPRQTRKGARINTVVLIVVGVDQSNSPRISHDDFVSQSAQQSADPRRVSSYLDYDPAPDLTRELRGKPSRGRSKCALLGDFPFPAEDAVVTVFVADVNANDLTSLPAAAFSRFRLFASLRNLDTLFQGWSPFCTVECVDLIEAISKPSIMGASLLIPSRVRWARR
jgi:hypothetical protein